MRQKFPDKRTEEKGRLGRKPASPSVSPGGQRLTMMTPVSLLASMIVTKHVAGRTAARMSSASTCPFTLDTGTKVTSEE